MHINGIELIIIYFISFVMNHGMSKIRYVECTSSLIRALVLFKKLFPSHGKKEIETFLSKAVKYLEGMQEEDGSWNGNWGKCYATYFAIKGLVATRNTYQNSSTLRRGVEFLLKIQSPDGGWGESHISCTQKKYNPLFHGILPILFKLPLL